jgi:acetyl-CoA carboxylase biotin carboxyl carrier protein
MLDIEWIENIAKAVAGSPVTDLTVVNSGSEVRLSRLPTSEAAAAPEMAAYDSPAALPVPDHPVRAQRVGVYHRPQRPVHAGDRIEAGEIVGFIESMRIQNEVVAERSGIVSQVLVEDGSPVEYGQELMLLKETSHEQRSLEQ